MKKIKRIPYIIGHVELHHNTTTHFQKLKIALNVLASTVPTPDARAFMLLGDHSFCFVILLKVLD